MAKTKPAELLDENGFFYEPRVYYSEFRFDGTGATYNVYSDPQAFRNGEQFPVRITHVTAHMLPGGSVNDNIWTTGAGDPRALAFYGLRVMDHDTYYPSGLPAMIPLLHNSPGPTSPFSSLGTSVWRFPKPFILGNMDTIEARADYQRNRPGGSIYAGIAFDGYGLYSKRPYKLGSKFVFDTTPVQDTFLFPPESLRNDGVEPIVITTMSVSALGNSLENFNNSLLETMRIGIKINGNSTNGQWMVAPNDPAFIRVPAAALGVNSGYCMSHEIPDNGWVFEPGEGVIVEATAIYGDTALGAGLNPAATITPDRTESLLIALCGYVIAQ